MASRLSTENEEFYCENCGEKQSADQGHCPRCGLIFSKPKKNIFSIEFIIKDLGLWMLMIRDFLYRKSRKEIYDSSVKKISKIPETIGTIAMALLAGALAFFLIKTDELSLSTKIEMVCYTIIGLFISVLVAIIPRMFTLKGTK